MRRSIPQGNKVKLTYYDYEITIPSFMKPGLHSLCEQGLLRVNPLEAMDLDLPSQVIRIPLRLNLTSASVKSPGPYYDEDSV